MFEPRAEEKVRIVTGRNAEGDDVFGFLVKRAYRVAQSGECVPTQVAPFREIDEYWGDPESSGPRREAELMAFKPRTDFIVLGNAYSPQAEPSSRFDIDVQIGGMRKTIAVFGDRFAYADGARITFSDPQPCGAVPVTFERAYGGGAYPRNPVGQGFVGAAMPDCPVRLPNFEDSADLLTPERFVLGDRKHWNRQPLPQGLGWFGKTWYPRMSYAGVIPGEVDADETMREEGLGLVPAKHIALARQFRLPSWDARFANGASPGLAIERLDGNETVQLTNLTPGGTMAFRLPGGAPVIVADIGAGETRPEVRLHSVEIEPEPGDVSLIWGASVPYPGPAWLTHMKRLAGYVV